MRTAAPNSRQQRILREPIDLTFYAVNSMLAVANLAVAAVGRGDVGRHVAATAGFLAALVLPCILSVAEDALRARPGARGTAVRVLRFLRMFYVHAFYGPWFAEVILLSQAISAGASLDALIASAEQAVFGFQPALAFSSALSHLKSVNELMFFGYFSYYPIITTGFWALFLRGHQEEARRALFLATTAFAVLYVWYLLVPVQGPKYFFESLNTRWYSEFEGWVFVPLMRAIFENMNLAGAALPSSHVAIGLIAVLLIRRRLPRAYLLYLVLFVLLSLSTVYIYAHYLIDVVAGVAVVPPLLWVARRLYGPACGVTGISDQKKGDASA